MSFLAPLFLFGLLAAAIPVAIHLIRREKPPKVQFSSLRFLKNTKRKLVLFQQIQQWLLLLLRAALILLLVFAFARPLFYSTPLANLMDSEPESVVVLLDTSLTMQHGGRFQRMQREAREVLGRLSAGDEAAVVSFDSAPRQVRQLTPDTDSLRGFVDGMEAPGYEVSRFYAALRLADELLDGARNSNRRVVMISDFQAAGMDDADSSWMLMPGVTFEGTDVGAGPVRNLTFTDVRTPGQLLEGVTDYEVLARLRSTGTVHVDTAEVTLRINGEPVASESLTLDRTSEAVVTLPVSFEEQGQYLGELTVTGDDFDADNRHYFSVNVLPRVQVLIVNGAPSINWYEDAAHWFSLALAGDGNVPFSSQTVLVSDLSDTLIDEHDIVVMLDVPSLSDSQAQQLERYVTGGGNLWIAPGRSVNAAGFNAQFAAVAPAQLTDAVDLGQNDYLLVADIDRRHPAIAPLDVEWNTRFHGYWESEPAADTQVLMRFDNGAPALMERNVDQGQVLMFTSALDTSWSNLPLQGLYLPFVHESLNYLVQPPARLRGFMVGETIDLERELQAGAGTLQVLAPDGSRQQFQEGNAAFRAAQPGFLTVGEQESGQVYAVNINPVASNMERTQIATLHDRIINPETTPMVSERVRTAQLAVELEQPQRMWWWILLLVMLLLPLETLVANRTWR